MKPWLDEAQIETWTPFFDRSLPASAPAPDLFQRHKHRSMTDTPLPRLNAKRRDAEIHAPNGHPRSILDVARYRNGLALSCEARVERAAGTTAGPRLPVQVITASRARVRRPCQHQWRASSDPTPS